MNNVPTKIFFTSGIGQHAEKLVSFELALRDAGIEKCNLVYVSSIFPPNCSWISKEEGIALLKPGQITFCVMARSETDQSGQTIASSIGVAVPRGGESHGYISECHEYTENSGEYAEKLAIEMVTTALGLSKDALQTKHIAIEATTKNGLWTTTVAAAVFL